MVISCEDVGLADTNALSYTLSGWLATKEATTSFTVAPGMKVEFLGPVILYLCRASKNREGDDFCWYVMERRKQGWRLQVPDFALDEHTDRGRQMGRGRDFWFAEASKLSPAVEIQGNKYGALVRQLLQHPSLFDEEK